MRISSKAWGGLALVATLIAAWMAPPLDEDSVRPSERKTRNGTGLSQMVAPASGITTGPSSRDGNASRFVAPEVLLIRPRQVQDDADPSGRLFASPPWRMEHVATLPAPLAPRPQAVELASEPVSEAPPQAPPLPFQMLGLYQEGTDTVAFLKHAERNLVVRAGDTLADQYLIESIRDGRVTLRYTPLNQVQTIDLARVP